MTSKDSSSEEIEGVKRLTVPANTSSDHIRGSVGNTPITLVEYGDYECSYTGMAYPIAKELIRQFGDYKIYFVFRTGRSDYPNQVNNAVVFPSVLRALLDTSVKGLDEKMLVTAKIRQN